jgi:hypothetical protein
MIAVLGLTAPVRNRQSGRHVIVSCGEYGDR